MNDDSYIEMIGRAHIAAKEQAFNEIIDEIKDEDYTTISQVVGALKTRLDILQRLK